MTCPCPCHFSEFTSSAEVNALQTSCEHCVPVQTCGNCGKCIKPYKNRWIHTTNYLGCNPDANADFYPTATPEKPEHFSDGSPVELYKQMQDYL